MARARRHASQAPGTGAARQPEQHRLGLVAAGVRQRHTLGSETAERLTIEIKPDVTAGDLQRLPGLPGQRGHVGMGDVARQVEPERQTLHKRAIIVGRTATDVVVEVSHPGEPEVSLGGQNAQGQ